MGASATTIEQMVEDAIKAASESILADYKLNLQRAIEIGAEIGAAKGAEAGAAAATKAAERERKKEKRQQHDRRYHNTKLLLRNYRQLNDYYQNAIFDIEGALEADEDFEEIMRSFGVGFKEKDLTADSIKRNYLVTRVVMSHVNTMLEVYEAECGRSRREEDKRRWRILHALYLADEQTTADALAQQEGIDKRTVYRDIDSCAEDLTILFFGLAGLEFR